MMLRRLYLFIVLLIVAGVAAFYLFVSYNEYSSPIRSIHKTKTFVLKKNATFSAFIRYLEKRHYITYHYPTYFFSWLENYNLQIKPGEYAIHPKTSVKELIRKVLQGKNYVRKITFPEGWTLHQIKQRLHETPFLVGDTELSLNEGDLFPATYHYSYGDERKVVLLKMRLEMEKKLNKLWEGRDKNIPLKSKEEAVVLASLIEKETHHAKERPLVAGVYINRLRKKMRLQSCPSVIYAITKGKTARGRVTSKDLQFKSPYNTYRNAGLPPTPICAPSYASLKAALNPAKTDYLFFVLNKNGEHTFTKTFQEHKINKRKNRKK